MILFTYQRTRLCFVYFPFFFIFVLRNLINLYLQDAYNFTVEFFWSPFLVDLNKNHSSGKKVLMLDKLSPNSEYWPGGDIMIFNSGMWWAQSGYKKGYVANYPQLNFVW